MQRRLSVQISTLMDSIQAQQEAALAEQDDVNETLQLYRQQVVFPRNGALYVATAAAVVVVIVGGGGGTRLPQSRLSL